MEVKFISCYLHQLDHNTNEQIPFPNLSHSSHRRHTTRTFFSSLSLIYLDSNSKRAKMLYRSSTTADWLAVADGEVHFREARGYFRGAGRIREWGRSAEHRHDIKGDVEAWAVEQDFAVFRSVSGHFPCTFKLLRIADSINSHITSRRRHLAYPVTRLLISKRHLHDTNRWSPSILTGTTIE